MCVCVCVLVRVYVSLLLSSPPSLSTPKQNSTVFLKVSPETGCPGRVRLKTDREPSEPLSRFCGRAPSVHFVGRSAKQLDKYINRRIESALWAKPTLKVVSFESSQRGVLRSAMGLLPLRSPWPCTAYFVYTGLFLLLLVRFCHLVLKICHPETELRLELPGCKPRAQPITARDPLVFFFSKINFPCPVRSSHLSPPLF